MEMFTFSEIGLNSAYICLIKLKFGSSIYIIVTRELGVFG